MTNYSKKNLLEYIVGFLFIVILCFYFYFTFTNEVKFKYFMQQNDRLNKLLILDEALNSFIDKRFEVIVFDDINHKLTSFYEIQNQLIQSEKENNLSSQYLECLRKIKKSYQEKEFYIERIKYHKAFETNILFAMLDIDNSEFSKLPIEKQEIIYKIKINFINSLVYRETEKSTILINSYRNIPNLNNDYWSSFLSRAEAMIDSIKEQEKNYNKLSKINQNQYIVDSKNILKDIIDKKEKLNTAIEFFLWLTVIVLSTLLIYFYRNQKNSNIELDAFKTAVENSFNVVVITDENMNITYVNELFEKITGYPKEYVLGKNPSFLKSGLQDDQFYKTLISTIKNGEKWEGRFINKDKNENLLYEDATITPIIDKENKVKGYLSIKRDVTQNVKNEKLLDELNNHLQEEIKKQVRDISNKENQLLEQRKLVSMGEMLGNIAHQWRQPLAGISATLLNIESKLFILQSNKEIQENEKLTNFFEFLESKNDKIKNYVHYLSDTIDIFRNFIKNDKAYTKCVLQELINETLYVIDATIKNNYIELINTIDTTTDIKVTVVKGELSQVIINIINNAVDAIKERNIQKPWIKIELLTKENDVIISIEDNAGGIPAHIQSKIFDPYFTTKHQSQGTGLGLHMSYKIVVESLHGKLYTTNTPTGSKFFIQIPLK